MKSTPVFTLFIMFYVAIITGIVIGTLIDAGQMQTVTYHHHTCIVRGGGLSQTMSCFPNTQQKGK